MLRFKEFICHEFNLEFGKQPERTKFQFEIRKFYAHGANSAKPGKNGVSHL